MLLEFTTVRNMPPFHAISNTIQQQLVQLKVPKMFFNLENLINPMVKI